jgi:hypothetical protein
LDIDFGIYLGLGIWNLEVNGARLMNRRELKRIDARIKTIKKAAQELKDLSGGIQAIDRNASRILASTKMLEINISDLLDLKILR